MISICALLSSTASSSQVGAGCPLSIGQIDLRVLARSVRIDSQVVSLAKAPANSMTPTTKLVHPFHCLLERGASGDRQLFQFRRRRPSAQIMRRAQQFR
jgi:hypothetical protein